MNKYLTSETRSVEEIRSYMDGINKKIPLYPRLKMHKD